MNNKVHVANDELVESRKLDQAIHDAQAAFDIELSKAQSLEIELDTIRGERHEYMVKYLLMQKSTPKYKNVKKIKSDCFMSKSKYKE